MKKQALIKQLAESTYVMIQPSPIHGIGVFAIRDIPKPFGVNMAHIIGYVGPVTDTEIEKIITEREKQLLKNR